MATKKIQLLGSLGARVYTQTDEPVDAADGSVWIDLDEESFGIVKNNDLDTFITNTDIDHSYDDTTGAYYTVTRIYRDKLDGTKQYPFVYAPNGISSGNKSTYDMAVSDGWLFALNAGVFDMTNTTPKSLLIENGQLLQDVDITMPHKSLTIDNNGNLGYSEPTDSVNNLIANGTISAVCGFGPIIVDYLPINETDYPDSNNWTISAQRQIIGQFGNGDYAVITCEGRNFHNSDGWTIPEAQEICQRVGLKFAYNLDGGGSTETVLGNKQINTIYENTTGRKVPTYIVFNGTTALNKPVNTDFTFIDYIQTDGNQYINTGLSESEIYTVEYKAKNEKWNTQAGHIFTGNKVTTAFLKMMNEQPSWSGWYWDDGSGAYGSPGTAVNIDTSTPYVVKSEYDGNAVTVYINGENCGVVTVGTQHSTTQNYYICAYGANPAATHYAFTGKLYYLVVHRYDGELVRHFVPAIRNSDNVVGLYDKVQGVFYSSISYKHFSA